MINDLCYVAFTLRLFYRLSVLTFPPIHHTEPCCLCTVFTTLVEQSNRSPKNVLVDMCAVVLPEFS